MPFLLADQSALNSPSFRAGRRGNSKALAILYGCPFLFFGREPESSPPDKSGGRQISPSPPQWLLFNLQKLPAPPHLSRVARHLPLKGKTRNESVPPTRSPSHSRPGRAACRTPRAPCFGQDRFTTNSTPDCLSLANPSRGRLGTVKRQFITSQPSVFLSVGECVMLSSERLTTAGECVTILPEGLSLIVPNEVCSWGLTCERSSFSYLSKPISSFPPAAEASETSSPTFQGSPIGYYSTLENSLFRLAGLRRRGDRPLRTLPFFDDFSPVTPTDGAQDGRPLHEGAFFAAKI